jgi:hypothetical protein
MRMEFRLVADLPRLARAARLRKADHSIEVLHGTPVEVRPSWFFEGAWDGTLNSDGLGACGAGPKSSC